MFEQIQKAAQKAENSKKSMLWKGNANPGFGSVPKKIVKKLPPSTPFNLTPLGRSPQDRISTNQEVAARLKVKKYLTTPNPVTGKTPHQELETYFDKHQVPKAKQPGVLDWFDIGRKVVSGGLDSAGKEAEGAFGFVASIPGKLKNIEGKAFGTGSISTYQPLRDTVKPENLLGAPLSTGLNAAIQTVQRIQTPSDFGSKTDAEVKKYNKKHGTDLSNRTSLLPKDTLKAATGKKIVLGSDLAKTLGIKDPIVQAIVGGVIDIGGTALFYPVSGVGSAVERGAINAAKRAGTSAAKAESTTIKKATKGIKQTAEQKTASEAAVNTAKKEAQQLNYNAYKAANPNTGSGLQVKIAGVPVPGITETTAALRSAVAKREAIRKAKGKAPRLNTIRQATRTTFSKVRPTVSPTATTKAAHAGSREAARKTRAALAKQSRQNAGLVRYLAKQNYTKAEQNAIIAEIESGNLVTPIAKLLDKKFTISRNRLVRQGIDVGDVVNAPRIKVQNIKDDIASMVEIKKVLDKEIITLTAKRAKIKKARNEQDPIASNASTEAITKINTKIRDASKSSQARDLEIKAAQRDLKQAEVAAANAPKGYVPHVRVEEQTTIRKKRSRTSSSTGSSRKIGVENQRTNNQPISNINASDAGYEFDTSLQNIVNKNLFQSSQRENRAILDKKLWRYGRKVKEDDPLLKATTGFDKYNTEGYYIFNKETQSIQKIPKWQKDAKAFPDAMLEELHNVLANNAGSGFGEIFDKYQTFWKKLAISTPGFNIRNMIGDLTQATLNSNLQNVVRDLGSSGRVIRRLSQIDKSYGNPLVPLAAPKKTLREFIGFNRGTHKVVDKFGNVTRLTDDQLIAGAVDRGVVRQGFVGGDVNESPSIFKTRSIKVDAEGNPIPSDIRNKKFWDKFRTDGTRRWRQNREDLARILTYKYGLKKGLTEDQAATRALKVHFDYGDLTSFERRIAHRAMPFYTWTARNIPYQAEKLATNPGKYAAFNAVRQETAKLFGFPLNWIDTLSPMQAEMMPVPISGITDGSVDPSNLKGLLVSWGSPETDTKYSLDLISLVANGVIHPDSIPDGFKKLMNDFVRTAANLLGPLKTLVEIPFNYSVFYGGPISSPYQKGKDLIRGPQLLCKALDVVGLASDIGCEKAKDGSWLWPKKVDYAIRSIIPGEVASLIGYDKDENLLNFLPSVTGIKAKPYNPESRLKTAYGKTVDKLDEVNGSIQDYDKRGISPAFSDYRRLQREKAMLSREKKKMENQMNLSGKTAPPPSSGSSGIDSGGPLGGSNGSLTGGGL